MIIIFSTLNMMRSPQKIRRKSMKRARIKKFLKKNMSINRIIWTLSPLTPHKKIYCEVWNQLCKL